VEAGLQALRSLRKRGGLDDIFHRAPAKTPSKTPSKR
jgi:hypothetical protein